MSRDVEDWKSLLYDRLKGCSRPVFQFEEATIPGASVWTGARKWVSAFRDQNLKPGDRVILDLPAGPAFVQALVACIWEQYSLVLSPPGESAALTDQLDARFRIVPDGEASTEHDWETRSLAGPGPAPDSFRDLSYSRTPDVRFVLRSSGSTGSGSWYGLSDGNVLSVLESHVDRMRGADVALSYLPWFHCFGLVLGLLYYIHESMVVIRDPAGGRSVPRLQQLADEHEVDHFNSVPLVIDRLRTVQSQPLYEQLDEGIVGGAPIRPPVADALRGTNMRVGYGQTEASPGIALGDQGDFSTNYLGQPVGCELRENDSGELEFRGPNAYRARFPTGEPPQKREVPRWVPTGDLGQDTGEGFYFQGRRDRSFKLANGQFIRPDVHEQKLVNGLGAIHEAVIIPSGTGGISVAVDSSKSPSQLEESVRDEMRDVEQYIDTVVSLGEVEIKTNNKGEYRRGASSLDQPVDSGMAV